MAQFDFTDIYDQYPSIIAMMENEFTSHEFILKFAQAHQTLYVKALYAYRNTVHREQPAPFLMVHRELANGLASSDLVERLGQVNSHDIFGQPNRCTKWCKVA